jgi:hypothetical protein
MMLAYGFKTELLGEPVRAGLAMATTERMVAGGARHAGYPPRQRDPL